jgi:hypothetical protein
VQGRPAADYSYALDGPENLQTGQNLENDFFHHYDISDKILTLSPNPILIK